MDKNTIGTFFGQPIVSEDPHLRAAFKFLREENDKLQKKLYDIEYNNIFKNECTCLNRKKSKRLSPLDYIRHLLKG